MCHLVLFFFVMKPTSHTGTNHANRAQQNPVVAETGEAWRLSRLGSGRVSVACEGSTTLASGVDPGTRGHAGLFLGRGTVAHSSTVIPWPTHASIVKAQCAFSWHGQDLKKLRRRRAARRRRRRNRPGGRRRKRAASSSRRFRQNDCSTSGQWHITLYLQCSFSTSGSSLRKKLGINKAHLCTPEPQREPAFSVNFSSVRVFQSQAVVILFCQLQLAYWQRWLLFVLV